jgi:hypothetical protein
MPGAYELQDLRPPQPTLEGDARFVGWNCKVPRWQLPPGFYPRAENKRAHRGTLEDREGTTTPVFANSFAAGTLLGAGPFTNMNGREILLLATRNQVIGVRSGSIAIDIDCAVDPSGKFAASFVNNYSIYDSVLHVFAATSNTSDIAIVGLYPYRAGTGLIIAKRRGFDLMGPIPNDLGDAFVKTFASFQAGNFITPGGPPPASILPIQGTSGVGMVSHEAGLFVEDDFHFLTDAKPGGIAKLTPSGNELRLDRTFVSDPIEPFFARVNWPYAGNAVANTDGTFVYWALPIDGSQYNNAVIVYHIASQQWMGVDLWFRRSTAGRGNRTEALLPNALRIDALVGADYLGRRRIFAVDTDSALIRLLYEGREDQLNLADKTGIERQTWPIRGLAETRGYATVGSTGNTQRKMNALQMTLSVYDANYTIAELVQGAGDERVLVDGFQPDRTKYDLLGLAPYQVNNANNDFLLPNRQDYSVRTGDGFTVFGGAVRGTTVPVPLEVEQERTENLSLSREGRYVSYRLTNEAGNAALVGTVVESQPLSTERSAA